MDANMTGRSGVIDRQIRDGGSGVVVEGTLGIINDDSRVV